VEADAMRKMKTKTGQEITVPEKGERHPGSGRVKGQPNKISMAQKLAMVWAAENSDHSADKTLQGFYLFIANKFPQDHARNLNRILPLQVDARHEIRQKVVYRSAEEIKAAMVERGMSQQRVDAIERALQSEVPQPIDYSKPRDLVAHPLPPDEDVKPGLQDHDGDDVGDDLDPQWGPAVASRRM
jgi:hypothetical protein